MLLACSSGDTVDSFARDGLGDLGKETQSCLHDLLKEQIENGELPRFDPAMRELSRESQVFAQFCHTVLHAVGFELGQDASFAERLQESGQGSCIFGYGHGLLEGFAHVHPDPTDDEFMVAVEACASFGPDAATSSRGLCADGLGHAAWNSTSDFARSAQLCDLIAYDNLRAVCAGGVVMQIYAPVNDSGSSIDTKMKMHAAAAQDLGALCNAWDGSAAGQRGCHKGAGYVYTRLVHVHASQLLGGGSTDHTEQRELVRNRMAEALQLCENHATEGRALCLDEVKAQVPPAAFVDDELNELLCVLLTPDRSGCPLVFKRFDNVN